jgi:thiol:disulfide interchange protein DsbD
MNRLLSHLASRLAGALLAIVSVFAPVALWALPGAALAQFAPPAGGTVSAVVQTPQVRAELLAFAPDGIGAGKNIWLGLQLAHQPHWHTYWKNAGDSGLPTRLEWSLPAGAVAGDIAWPTPQKIDIGSLSNYGYEGTVLLPVPLTIGKDFKPSALADALEVKLSASWLVCKEECVPQDGKFVLQVPLKGSTALHAGAFEQSRAAVPLALSGSAEMQLAKDGLTLHVRGLPEAWRGKNISAFIETPEIIETAHSPSANGSARHVQSWQADGSWSASIPLSAMRAEAPGRLAFVLSRDGQNLRTEGPVQGSWPALGTAAMPAASNQLSQPAIPVPAAEQGLAAWGLALAAALLGGLILNLMPCVFPVLAIKVLAFTKPAERGHSHRAQGLAYTAGVVASFLALGGLMLALRAGGEQLGWGFQLQSPGVIAVLALLFTLIGLNLMGLLEVGNLLPGNLASVQLRHPLGDAFLSGVLAVAIASPCTAPFMGASLGYAIALPAVQALGIFAALGVGLALPYLAASWLPRVGAWLPRPGAWMDTLRRFMAFPMWATVVWLVWVLGHLSGVDGAASLLALLLCLALLVWSLNQAGRSRTVIASLALLGGVWLASSVGPNIFKLEEAQALPANAGPNPAAGTWQAWVPGRVDAELAAGKPVFVDFTAAWCITCQYNKKTTLARADVLADFQAKNVTLLRADWTRRDPAISQALSSLGRSGVPVYVVYQAGRAPQVLSEVLGVDELRAALARL